MRVSALAATLLTASALGFQAHAAEYTVYTFEVSAGEQTPHALSHIEFQFTEEGSAVMAPYGDHVLVDRSTGSGTEQVEYVVIQDNTEVIKFEDAPDGLGEDGATETDTFHVHVRDSNSQPSSSPRKHRPVRSRRSSRLKKGHPSVTSWALRSRWWISAPKTMPTRFMTELRLACPSSRSIGARSTSA